MTYDTDHLTTWHLASMADAGRPDVGDRIGVAVGLAPTEAVPSPGAVWLRDVAEAFAEQWNFVADQFGPGEPWGPELELERPIHEVADDAIPVNTHEMWQVFVDLCAYRDEVVHDEFTDLHKMAAYALYAIAERLCWALAEDAQEANQ